MNFIAYNRSRVILQSADYDILKQCLFNLAIQNVGESYCIHDEGYNRNPALYSVKRFEKEDATRNWHGLSDGIKTTECDGDKIKVKVSQYKS